MVSLVGISSVIILTNSVILFTTARELLFFKLSIYSIPLFALRNFSFSRSFSKAPLFLSGCKSMRILFNFFLIISRSLLSSQILFLSDLSKCKPYNLSYHLLNKRIYRMSDPLVNGIYLFHYL